MDSEIVSAATQIQEPTKGKKRSLRKEVDVKSKPMQKFETEKPHKTQRKRKRTKKTRRRSPSSSSSSSSDHKKRKRKSSDR